MYSLMVRLHSIAAKVWNHSTKLPSNCVVDSLCYARVTEVEIHRLDRIYFLVAATTEVFAKVSMICT